MSRTTAVLSLGYWFSSFSMGLLVHPYKTMRQIVREDIMAKLRFLPLVLWVMSWILGLVLLRVVGMIAGFVPEIMVGYVKWGVGFLFVWWSVFVGLWQGLLLYLWWRFMAVIR